jgi:hypothetical protein
VRIVKEVVLVGGNGSRISSRGRGSGAWETKKENQELTNTRVRSEIKQWLLTKLAEIYQKTS